MKISYLTFIVAVFFGSCSLRTGEAISNLADKKVKQAKLSEYSHFIVTKTGDTVSGTKLAITEALFNSNVTNFNIAGKSFDESEVISFQNKRKFAKRIPRSANGWVAYMVRGKVSLLGGFTIGSTMKYNPNTKTYSAGSYPYQTLYVEDGKDGFDFLTMNKLKELVGENQEATKLLADAKMTDVSVYYLKEITAIFETLNKRK